MNHKLTRAQAQRYIGLVNALKTIDAFIIPSADPLTAKKYDEVKKYLLKQYKIDDKELNNYKFPTR